MINTALTPSTHEELGKGRIPLLNPPSDAIHSSLLREALIHPCGWWRSEVEESTTHNRCAHYFNLISLFQTNRVCSSTSAHSPGTNSVKPRQDPQSASFSLTMNNSNGHEKELHHSGLFNTPATPSLDTLHGHHSWGCSRKPTGALSGRAGPDQVAIYCPFDHTFLLCEAEVGLRGEGLAGWRASTHLTPPQRSILQPPTQKSSN